LRFAPLATTTASVRSGVQRFSGDHTELEENVEIAKIADVTIDTVDPQALAPFWAALLGVEVDGQISDGEYVLLRRVDPGGPAVAFQRVPEPKSGKTRIHLDLAVADLDEATKAIEELGGTWVE